MSKPKEATRERVAVMLQRAVEGSERLGMSDVADRYREMSIEDYADEKSIRLINPATAETTTHPRSTRTMSTVFNDTRTKQQVLENEQELLTLLDEVWNVLVDLGDDDSQDDLAEGVAEVCELLNDFDDERFPWGDAEEEETTEETEAVPA